MNNNLNAYAFVIVFNLANYLTFNSYGQTVIISGRVIESKSGETLSSVNVHESNRVICVSNFYGFYSISIPSNSLFHLIFSHVGYKNQVIEVNSSKDTVINVTLDPISFQLDEIVITGQPDFGNFQYTHSISPGIIKELPMFLGEKDPLKALQLIPGVQRGVEGSTAFYVRGGGSDQNLLLVDDAPLYNSNHLFGFLSSLNNDAIKSFQFYKGIFPASFGGRVASVTSVQMREGNKDKFQAQGGIGILSSRLTLEGPIKGNSTYLFSGRRSFIDLLTKPFMSTNNKEWYRFFDFNGKVNFEWSKSNRLIGNFYNGGDEVNTKDNVKKDQSTTLSTTKLGWVNRNASLRWNHILSKRWFSNVGFYYSFYKFYLTDSYEKEGISPSFSFLEYRSAVNDFSIKNDFDYFSGKGHTWKYGLNISFRELSPRIFNSIVPDLQSDRVKQKYKQREVGLHAQDDWEISKRLHASYGARFTIVDAAGSEYKRLEPILQFSILLSKQFKLMAGYRRSNQFIHSLSNTGIGLPTDLWVPANSIIPPQRGDIFSCGITGLSVSKKYSFTIETYRRILKNIVSYKPEAQFLSIDDFSSEFRWEENVTTGTGVSYGTEFCLEKKNGRLTGWTSYTLAWTIHQFAEINNGKRFFPKYDSRHNLNLVVNYKISDKIVFSAAWVFSSGTPLSVPQAYYYSNFAPGYEVRPHFTSSGVTFPLVKEEIGSVPYIKNRNSFRGESYHRLDLNIQLKKKKKGFERYWEFGVFNAYNRKNPYYYYLASSNDFVNNGQRIELKKKWLFPILPSISYNFKF